MREEVVSAGLEAGALAAFEGRASPSRSAPWDGVATRRGDRRSRDVRRLDCATAGVEEPVDSAPSKGAARRRVRVRVPPPALNRASQTTWASRTRFPLANR